jgi:hypothetical protein
MSELVFLQECRQAIRDGYLRDDPDSPIHVVVTVVGSQRSDRDADAYDFILSVAKKYPHAEVKVGDTSTVEKQAALAAEHMDLPLTVVKKADKGDWDEGADIRDERVVAGCTQVVCFDKSARSQSYLRLAKRLNIKTHQL